MFNNRTLYKLFSLFSILVVLAAGARLFYLQVVQHSFYDRIVETQSSTRLTFTKDRGLILDRTGKPLAQNRKMASLYTFGKNVEDPAQFIKDLQANGIKISNSVKNAVETKSGFIWIVRHIDIEKAEAIKKAVPNVEYCLEDARFYPEGKIMAGLIGYTGVDNQGLEGIEYYSDSILAGREIPVSTIRDSRGKLILFDDGAIQTRPDSAVYLTVDLQLQAVTDRILKKDLAEFRAKQAVALAMDIKTGEVLVAAYVHDPKLKGVSETKNYASTYLFEPGSIFKTVTFGYLIESGLYKPDVVVNTSKPVTLHGHSIKDVYTYPSLTQKEVFTKSSNIGTVQLTSKASRESFYKYLTDSGFGRKVGIEGMAEEAGMLREPKKWSGLSQASLSIGQEIMVTPIQVVRYYAAVANKGIAANPSIVHHYVQREDAVYPKTSSERIMSEETAATLMEMLTATVETGSGRRAHSSLFEIGGKTGTAQVIDQRTQTYSKTEYVASFAGVFPIDDPRVAMVVIYESPKSSIYGGATGAATFRKIAEQIAFYYNLGGENTKVHYVSN